ncbi:unnamed protein product [Moneuplotes crassus]|uniref:Uncharacterized protein n=1 Tax=Euplotes crassus TaxID=5936 RepID=A0AAD1XT39_EUPCR|nr:unnamed protein product [Moneuplotes crassus]
MEPSENLDKEITLLEKEDKIHKTIHLNFCCEFRNQISFYEFIYTLNWIEGDRCLIQFLKLPMEKSFVFGLAVKCSDRMRVKSLCSVLKLSKSNRINFIEIESKDRAKSDIKPFLIHSHDIFDRIIYRCNFTYLYFTEKSTIKIFQRCRNILCLLFNKCKFDQITKDSKCIYPCRLTRLKFISCVYCQDNKTKTQKGSLNSLLRYLKAQNLFSSITSLIIDPQIGQTPLQDLQELTFSP